MTAKKHVTYTIDARLAVLEDNRSAMDETLKRIEAMVTTTNAKVDNLAITLNSKIDASAITLNNKIDNLGNALRGEMKEMKTELKAEIGGIKHYIHLIGYTVAATSFGIILKTLFPGKFG